MESLKKHCQKFMKRNRKLFRWMGLNIGLLFLTGFIIIALMLVYQQKVELYLSQDILTIEAVIISILGMIFLLLTFSLVLLVVAFITKIMIPARFFDILTMKEEREFLGKLPQNIRKEILRDE